MRTHKEELCDYVDGCVANSIPMNTFTYTIYRLTNTPWLVKSIRRLIANCY